MGLSRLSNISKDRRAANLTSARAAKGPAYAAGSEHSLVIMLCCVDSVLSTNLDGH